MMVRKGCLNPLYPEHMIRLYVNLKKWSKKSVRRPKYCLAEDNEARITEWMNEQRNSDGEQPSTSRVQSEAAEGMETESNMEEEEGSEEAVD
uniref:Uncharacterized protein n=1 Tax=Trichuris muris TaxID=70415 RepID=A0A5S6Q9L4_TRIMR